MLYHCCEPQIEKWHCLVFFPTKSQLCLAIYNFLYVKFSDQTEQCLYLHKCTGIPKISWLMCSTANVKNSIASYNKAKRLVRLGFLKS